MTAPATTDLSTGTWTIDPAHTSIGFAVRNLMVSKVRGTFGTFDGAIVVAEDGAPSVTAEIQVGSLYTGNAQRDEHVRSADFLDVAQYPTATFSSTGVRADGDHYVLDGDFTLKGNIRPISLVLHVNGVSPGMGHGEVAGFEASVVIDRRDFGVDIDMPLPTGGAVVGNEVTITLSIEAVKQA